VVLVVLVLSLVEALAWLTMMTAAGACSKARRAGASPRGEHRRWLRCCPLLEHVVGLVLLVLLLGESIGFGGDGGCCWSMQ
jgi:hypothetical protein